jgi:hypothetical protein
MSDSTENWNIEKKTEIRDRSGKIATNPESPGDILLVQAGSPQPAARSFLHHRLHGFLEKLVQ